MSGYFDQMQEHLLISGAFTGSPGLNKSREARPDGVIYNSRAASADMARASTAPMGPSQQGDNLSRSVSIGSSMYSEGTHRNSDGHRFESSQLSPVAASFISSEDGSVTSPTAIIQRPIWTEADAARETRRRKLMKIQAFLGERVPASALSDVPGVVSKPVANRRVPVFSKASNNIQRRLTKGKHSGMSLSDREGESRKTHGRRAKGGYSHYGSTSMDERSRSNPQNPDAAIDEPNHNVSAWIANSRPQPTRLKHNYALPEDPALGEIGKAAEPVILAVRRARKLERVSQMSHWDRH